MFIPVLYKREMKGLWKTLLIFAAILTLYISMIVSMFDPELQEQLNSFYETMPEFMRIVGMSGDSATLTGHMATYLYGFVLLVFPMVFSIICGNRLVARYTDRGSMVCLLAAPHKRRAVALTQMTVMLSGILLLVLYASALEIAVSLGSFPGQLDFGGLAALNAALLCLHLFIGGVCFLSSCYFNDAKNSVAAGAGIPCVSMVLQMLSNSGGTAEKVKYITFFTLFDPHGVVAGRTAAYAGAAILLLGAVALFCLSVWIFSKKDLHI